ncbi:MAG: IS200/IS605 family transposase [Candidatus Micrarchaeaceae archaeon]
MNSESLGKFVHNAHSVGMSEYHLQWVTKYRYETLLKEQYYKDCKNAIRDAAKRHGIELLELSVMPDHFHIVAILPVGMTPGKAARLLKGYSAHELFRLHPKFRLRYLRNHFWDRGHFYRSVSNVNDESVRRYVREDNDPRQKWLVS